MRQPPNPKDPRIVILVVLARAVGWVVVVDLMVVVAAGEQLHTPAVRERLHTPQPDSGLLYHRCAVSLLKEYGKPPEAFGILSHSHLCQDAWTNIFFCTKPVSRLL